MKEEIQKRRLYIMTQEIAKKLLEQVLYAMINRTTSRKTPTGKRIWVTYYHSRMCTHEKVIISWMHNVCVYNSTWGRETVCLRDYFRTDHLKQNKGFAEKLKTWRNIFSCTSLKQFCMVIFLSHDQGELGNVSLTKMIVCLLFRKCQTQN